MNWFEPLRWIQIYPFSGLPRDAERVERMEKKLQEAIHYLGPKWVGVPNANLRGTKSKRLDHAAHSRNQSRDLLETIRRGTAR